MVDLITNRPNCISDWLMILHPYQWFTFSDPSNQVYENLILTPVYGVAGELVDNPNSLPTEQECINGLAQLQEDFDALEWKRNRQKEYPKIHDLVVALYDTEDKIAIDLKRAEIKLKYPKPI